MLTPMSVAVRLGLFLLLFLLLSLGVVAVITVHAISFVLVGFPLLVFLQLALDADDGTACFADLSLGVGPCEVVFVRVGGCLD